MSKERPILFSAEMVRAIIEGRKTQTRRVVKHKNGVVRVVGPFPEGEDGDMFIVEHEDFRQCHPTTAVDHSHITCPYGQVGDRLWVRETWAGRRDHSFEIEREGTCYRADGDYRSPAHTVWKPSIHMPRWASRILLEVTKVRVERVQGISESDALAEGAPRGLLELERRARKHSCDDYNHGCSKWFRQLWQGINGVESWVANPWVWVVEFKVVEIKGSAAAESEGK